MIGALSPLHALVHTTITITLMIVATTARFSSSTSPSSSSPPSCSIDMIIQGRIID